MISYPEIVLWMRNIAEAMIQMNGGLIDALRRTLYQKAYEFGINRLDLEDILKNPVPSTIINEKDGTQLALIYEGMFLAGGSRTKNGGGRSFPVQFPAYYLPLYPVTNIQYASFLNQAQPSEIDLDLERSKKRGSTLWTG
jgi:formylglycine-generating enzyme required for sulfatase activity